jgi:predicted ester cyclase
MQANEMKALASRFIEEAWNQGALEVIDEVYAQDCPLNGKPMGTEGFKKFIGMFRAAFPDIHLTIEEQLVIGDKLVSRTRTRGTHTGSFMGAPPTGNQIDVSAIAISRFENGKIIEEWENNDGLGMYRQLGLLPTRGRGPV